MGKLRKLRTRFISSIGAVKRSVLRRQSSTTSNSTTLTRLASLDSAVPSRTGSRGTRSQKRKPQVHLQSQEHEEQDQLQLHWNEARRIYSEPVQAIQRLSGGDENRSTSAIAECRSLVCGAGGQYDGRNACSTSSSLCDSAQAALAETQISDDEDYDDVFLQSWEEAGLIINS